MSDMIKVMAESVLIPLEKRNFIGELHVGYEGEVITVGIKGVDDFYKTKKVKTNLSTGQKYQVSYKKDTHWFFRDFQLTDDSMFRNGGTIENILKNFQEFFENKRKPPFRFSDAYKRVFSRELKKALQEDYNLLRKLLVVCATASQVNRNWYNRRNKDFLDEYVTFSPTEETLRDSEQFLFAFRKEVDMPRGWLDAGYELRMRPKRREQYLDQRMAQGRLLKK